MPRDDSNGEHVRTRQVVQRQTRRASLYQSWHIRKGFFYHNVHRNFLCKEEASFKQERCFLQALLSVHVAIVISSNFSKFSIKSFKIKAPKHPQYKVTRHCRTALRRQLKNLSLSSGIHIPSRSCILPNQIGHKPRSALTTSVLSKDQFPHLYPTGDSPTAAIHAAYHTLPLAISQLPPRPQKHLLSFSTCCLN